MREGGIRSGIHPFSNLANYANDDCCVLMARQRIFFSKKQSYWDRYKVKIASTSFAILVWFLIVIGETFDYVTDIPISAETVNQDYIVTKPIPAKAKIHIKGQGMALLGFLLFREGNVNLNFEWKAGTQRIQLSENNVNFPGSTQKIMLIDLIEPTQVDITIEQLVTKTVPIINKTEVVTMRGYTVVGDILLEPQKCDIRLPKSKIDSVSSIFTDAVKWERRKYQLKEQVNLIVPKDAVDMSVKRVNVFADVQKLMEKKINRVPVSVINQPSNMTAIVIPSQLSLTAIGGVNIVSLITESDVKAYIDYQKYRNSEQRDIPAYIEPIPHVKFTDISPQRFKVVLERR
jgi:hypothetical protein